VFGHPAAEDGGDLVGLADGAVSVQEAFFQSIQRGAAVEDQIVAVLRLGKEQAMLTARLFAFGLGEKMA